MSAVRPVDPINLFCMKALGVLFACVGGMLLVQFPSYYRSEVAFEANAISTTGTVIKTREEKEYSGGGIVPLSSKTKYISTVEFQTHQGKSVDFTTSSACSSKLSCENKTVQVRYEPSVPTQARINFNTPLHVRLWGYGVFSLISLLIGILLLVIDPDGRPGPIND
jgi:hypothetical protein